MSISWGYSPKIEKYIPLGDFPIDHYLVVAKQAIENLGWKLSHISESGLIAYTPISLQSYSEEISIRIVSNFAIVKSECIGLQMLFTDYGKNDQNLEKFFHEFEYVEFHLKEFWDDSLAKFHAFAAKQDDGYFEKAPLAVKNKIKNVLYLFVPRKGYLVTPILVYLNLIYYFLYVLLAKLADYNELYFGSDHFTVTLRDFYTHVFSNNRGLVLGGQIWRLITYSFVHLSYLHLFFNMYVLIYFGLMTENKLAASKFILLYLVTGLVGGLASIMAHDVGFGIGASGSVMGLTGAFMALLYSKTFEKNATRALLISISIPTAITLVNGIQSGIDNASHIGGLISGFVLTLLLIGGRVGRFGIAKQWRYATGGLVVVAFTIGVFLFTPNYHFSEFERLEEVFEQNSRDYHKVNEITSDLSTLQKIKKVRQYGIETWKQNVYVVNNMLLLKLDEEHAKTRDYYQQITGKTLELEFARYTFYKNNETEYRDKVKRLQIELADLKKQAKANAGLDLP